MIVQILALGFFFLVGCIFLNWLFDLTMQFGLKKSLQKGDRKMEWMIPMNIGICIIGFWYLDIMQLLVCFGGLCGVAGTLISFRLKDELEER